MYAVSEEYKQAIAQRRREFKLTANIYLRDKTILTLGDDDLNDNSLAKSDRYVKGDVKIESQMMSGGASDSMIDIGAVPAKKLTMTVRSDTTNLHVFSGAYLWLYVSLKLPSGAWEPVPMGKFYINGASVSREGNWVSFEAYDGMLKLQYELTDAMREQLKGKTAMAAAQILCGNQLPLGSAISPAGGYVECPNCELPLNFDSPQIETARDGIMWIAQIMGCFARVNRLGVLEFVPIKSWWKMYDETTGTILAVRNIQGGSRFKTKFSDDRIHIVGVSMRGEDGKLITKRYSYSHESGGDPTSDVTIELETNPLLNGCITPLEDILNNILTELSTAYFYAFQTEITNDPALDAGDTIRLQGGVINGTNKNNDLIGFITHSTWVYLKRQTITNASSVPIVYEDSSSSVALMSADGDGIAPLSDSEPLNFLPPRSQSDKAQLGIGDPERIICKQMPGAVLEWKDWQTLSATAYNTEVLKYSATTNELTLSPMGFPEVKAKIHLMHSGGNNALLEIVVSDSSASGSYMLYSDGTVITPQFKIIKSYSGNGFEGYINGRKILTE